MKKIRVLIIDDSPLIRQMFSAILGGTSDIEVVGTAEDPYDAREKIKQLDPDVVTLDIEMPKMDGLTFLERIIKLRPMPVIMASSLTQKNTSETLRALELGAVDYIPKTSSTSFNQQQLAAELIQKVRTASHAKIKSSTDIPQKKLTHSHHHPKTILAIGASTGGVEAIRHVLQAMPSNAPPIIITQHMPASFTAAFAERLNNVCPLNVHEAQQGQAITSGNAYIAPGGKHLELSPTSTGYNCQISNSDPVSGHKPSVDVMFSSCAQYVQQHCIAAILTGMGKDGTKGLIDIKRAGGKTIGQNEASCVVYGMPKSANIAGAVGNEFTINHIAQQLLLRAKEPPQ